MKETIYISGHRNPDTDSICSALAYANFKSKQDTLNQFVPIRLGNLNSETAFVLDYFKIDAPVLMESIGEGEKLIQVDHNEVPQAIQGVEKADLVEIVDHHRINGIFTAAPIYVRMEPVGCTATIISKLYKEHNFEIDSQTAGLLMSAIISDSLLFKSPTCTPLDEQTCRELAQVAKVEDLESFGLAMLKAGTSLTGKTIEEIFHTDFKDFSVGNDKFGVAQVNTMDIDGFMQDMKVDMQDYMNSLVAKEQYSFLLLALTDIIQEGSMLLSAGQETFVEKAFNIQMVDHACYVSGILSRKKQIIPVLTEVVAK